MIPTMIVIGKFLFRRLFSIPWHTPSKNIILEFVDYFFHWVIMVLNTAREFVYWGKYITDDFVYLGKTPLGISRWDNIGQEKSGWEFDLTTK